MKKKLAVLITIMMLIGLVAVPASASEPPITVTLDGATLSFDVPPTIENGRTLVPFRAIFEAMGATVSWDGEQRIASGVKGDISVALPIGSVDATINGEINALDVPAKIVEGRTLVPLRFVSESFGASVEWAGETRTITINSDGTVVPAPAATPVTAADFAKVIVANFAPVNASVNLTGTVAGIVQVGAEATAAIDAGGVASANIKGDAGPLGKSESTAALCPYSELIYGPEAEALNLVSTATLADSVIGVSGNVPASLVEFLNKVNDQVTWTEVTGDVAISIDSAANHVTQITISNGKAKVDTPLGAKDAVFNATFTYTY
ncbi:MAG: copper amine oxidase N-terminal domain-containing protein [Bacillota bacterium]|nr:copper amine oxidase N-terminal domain-containing protein [Bacillota bacterium]